ncbi:LamG domain-containing protein [Embleya sp. NPDC020886]|uniref:LamG domain-containing protein n=1 Tax=Embleya sp. NPDC020886 TaxID=3363980 RepID=UPI00379AF51A
MRDKTLTRTYRDRTYVSTAMVRHGGTTVAFAMDDRRRIYYSVLDLEQAQDKKGALDAAYWNAEPALLPFPAEIVDPYADVPVAFAMPTVKAGGTAEVRPQELFGAEVDPFLSTTARLTAAEPLQVVSDGRYILVFRQSVAVGHSDAVYQVTGAAVSGDAARTDFVMRGGAKVAAADASLLCDRFVLVGSALKPVVEARYQRSRSKYRPAAEGSDTLGTRDMDGKLFYEPTTKLSFVPQLTSGGFAVLLLPTEVDGVSRWQLFVNNAADKRIESFNCAQNADGLFDMVGKQFYTSPDSRFRKSVLEREPGIDPNTGRPLVPVPVIDRTGTALRFAAGRDFRAGLDAPQMSKPSGGCTFEAWVKPMAPGGTILSSFNESIATAFYLGLDAQYRPIAGRENAWTLTGTRALPRGEYAHVALVFDGLQAVLFVDGAEAGRTTVPTAPVPPAAQQMGYRTKASVPYDRLVGDVDEVRIWNRARTAADLVDRGQRLIGTEPDLVTYLRLDEGSGSAPANSCGGHDAWLRDVDWVDSDAPVGDGAGLSRYVFAIKDREVKGGLAATLYFQQEERPTGYGAVAAEKGQARVLLACATTGPAPKGGSAGRAYLCTLDFALARNGRLTAVPREVVLDGIGLPEPTNDLDRLAAAEEKVTAARTQLGADEKLAHFLPATLAYIDEIRSTRFRNAQREALERTLPEMYTARARLGSDRAQVIAAEGALATLSGGLRGGAESVLPMPRIAVDRAGLSVYGALLTFAWTDRAPSLLDSANGDVVLYFAGADGQFLSVYYPTTVSRATRILPAGASPVTLLARDPAARSADFAVTVGAGTAPELCTVRVSAGTVVETFPGVPRAVGDFARVLNGRSPQGELLGRVGVAQDTVVELAEPLPRALTAGTAIAVGGRLRTVAGAVAAGANKITVTVGGLADARGQDVRSALYDYALATCTTPGVSLTAGSRIVGADPVTAAADRKVVDGTTAEGAQPLLPRWRGNSPGRALTFDGRRQRLMLSRPDRPKVVPEANLSMEAWVNPTTIATSGHARIWHANIPEAPYFLALEQASDDSALHLDGAGTVWCGSKLALANRDFTIEFWAKRDAARDDVVFMHGGNSADGAALQISFTGSNQAHFGWRSPTDQQWDAVHGGADDLGWHCWTAVYENATRRRTLYCDGVQVAQDTAAAPYAGIGNTLFGSDDRGRSAAKGRFDEFRVWGRARTAEEVALTVKRRLTGQERDLLAYWTFADGVLADRTGNGHDGARNGSVIAFGQSAPYSYRVAARVRDQVVRSRAAFPLADWGHVAATFRQDWAMAMDGTAHLDTGGPEGLDLADDLTIEAFVKIDSLGVAPQGLVGKGALETGTEDAVPYAFYIDTDGQLAFTFEAGDGRDGSRHTYRSGTTVQVGKFTRVAVTRRGGEDKKGAVGIRFYIDGKLVGSDPHVYNGAKPIGNDANCEIGRFRVRTTTFGLRGTVSQVRIWNTARPADQIGTPITADAQGLLAWWRFPERSGAVTADACNTYPAQIRGAKRVRTPDPDGNRFTFYHNGVPGIAEPVALTTMLADMGADQQVTVGAKQMADGTLRDVLNGQLDELRLWRTCRTQEQILDTMFTRVRAAHNDMLAYYPIDPDSAVQGALVSDAGPAGCHLFPMSPPPGVAISHAPISDDTAQVRSALTGARTVFQSRISATPHSGEYADLQADTDGRMFGVMKRAYASIRDGAWTLTTGFKVGDLTTTWVGQAQFAPQLVGYLEGAPPVPSENLIHGTADTYNDTSSVKFVQANTVTNTLSSDHKTSVDTSAKLHFQASVSDDTFVIAAPLGAGTAKPLSSVKMSGGASAEMKFSSSWSNDTQVTQGATTTRTSAVNLTGHWEPDDAKRQVNPTAGRRWVPANTGFAIVQSDTADQYALRLAHNGALVAYRMVPNPDIPQDWNIIPFPINPRYTKQGTLDGLIGCAVDPATGVLKPFPDPDFPNAGDGNAYSYHRPREAYALKRRIQREEQQLQGFYDSVSTDAHAPDPVAAAADRVLKGMIGGTGTSTGLTAAGGGNAAEARAAHKSAARRNIANTYVWTAAGGLFSEVTSTTDQVVQTTAGDYSVSGSFTHDQDYAGEVAGVGFSGGFEVTLGGGYTVTRRRTKDSTRTFSLEVEAKPGRNLQKNEGGTPVFDAKNRPVLVPGRVDAYRFMSFYLDTSTDNFEDFYGKVVDPEWLDTGTDPHARELARARQSDRKPPCWRILHRVTYVSRVLDTSSGAPTLAKALGALGITSDHQLFTALQPHLVGATSRLADLTAATTTALTTNYPTLVPFTATITQRLAAYHQLPDPGATAAIAAPATPKNPTVTLPTTTHPQGSILTVGYTAPTDKITPKNWIGVYKTGADIAKGADVWEYAPAASGNVAIRESGRLPAGKYQVWFLHDDGYTPLAGPADLTVA